MTKGFWKGLGVFNTSLLRERFVISDSASGHKTEKEPVIALSNRLPLPLTIHSHEGDMSETLVVRAQNMHTCIRMAAKIAQDFADNGPIMDREKKPFDWRLAWLSIIKGYETKYNPRRWIAVYHKGRVVFAEGERHPFLDIIEQCDALNKSDYEQSVKIAENAFRQAGKAVNIEHDANVAVVLSVTADEAKCGVMVRGANRSNTFNFVAKKRAGRDVKPSQCLSVCAAFLDGIQLSFLVGMTNQKALYGLIDRSSEEGHQGDEASKKLGRLNGAILQFENLSHVVYRPDRPEFAKMIEEAEEFGRTVLAEQIKAKIASGEMKDGDWVV
jgi:hypothetical protein